MHAVICARFFESRKIFSCSGVGLGGGGVGGGNKDVMGGKKSGGGGRLFGTRSNQILSRRILLKNFFFQVRKFFVTASTFKFPPLLAIGFSLLIQHILQGGETSPLSYCLRLSTIKKLNRSVFVV